jgi:flagellar motor protein MotB
MAKNACRCKKTECEECPEWIFTFADLVMLMMGFFVILWVLKPSPTKSAEGAVDDHYLEVLAKIRDAFGYLPDPKSSDPVDVKLLLLKLQQMKPLKGPGDGGKTMRDRRGAEGTDTEVKTIREGKQAIVGTRILFDIGQSNLSPEATQDLDQIVSLIKGHRKIVQVKGNTSLDDFPESAAAQDRMNLSVRRAQAAADYLTAHGVEPDVLRVQGCSTFEPIIQRVYNTDARLVNRRVEIESTDTLVGERQGHPTVAPVNALNPATPPAD